MSILVRKLRQQRAPIQLLQTPVVYTANGEICGFLQSPLEKMQKSASFQKATLKLKHVDSAVDNENCDHVGVEELQGFEEPIRRRLKASTFSA